MEHQDWNQYIIHCKNPINVEKDVKNDKKKKNYAPNKDKKLEEKIKKGEPLNHKKIDKELSKKIQAARLEKGLTQKQLANRLSLPDKLINNIETGKAIYNGQQLSRINCFLKI